MEIRSELQIDAPPERVWELTVDVERWPSLTPTVTAVARLDDGPFGLGSQARIEQPGQRPAIWTVTDFVPNAVFSWQTKVATVTMRGGHRLEATADGGTRNALTISLTGLGSSLLGRLVGRKVRQAIQTENEGFKAEAERTSHETPS